jgi:molybdopterin-containing oxidoreductase family iron-sulfur binding subunit
MDPLKNSDCQKQKEDSHPQDKQCGRRDFLKGAAKVAAMGGAALLSGCGTGMLGSKEELSLQFKEYFKKNYPFNVTRCEGYMECVAACVKENNLDRKSNTQYIRIFEMEHGKMSPEVGDGKFFHQVPVADHFYMGVQCFHCQDAPCTKACPVKATWMEPDGIVVVDYDWCIGCRYCIAACPYYGRRFNWNEPVVPKEEMTKKQHYLGNRMRHRGQMEKCTFCVQRSRQGRLPACVEACPTGARVFGNLLDPDSEIRFVLKNKKVFRFKEDLGTDPKFWYFVD